MMQAGDIAFPHLNIYLHDVPKNFSIFGFTIAFYGVIIAIGIFLGLMMADWDRRRNELDGNTIWDVALWGIPFGIIGARIYYVIFYWDSYRDNILSIFNVRQGGLAIYGGVIGAIITVWVYARIKKESFFAIFDSISLGFLVGQLIGRWGNFFNREVFGGYTNNIFAMRLPIEAVRARDITPALEATIEQGTNYIQVHPTFLYESLWNLALLILLCLYSTHKKFQGEIFCLYIAGYGVGRFWIEYIRTDQLYIGNTKIPVSMVVAVGMIIVAAGIAFIQRKRLKTANASGTSSETEAAGTSPEDEAGRISPKAEAAETSPETENVVTSEKEDKGPAD